MAEPIAKFLLRLAPMIYGPTLLFALGQGALIPLIPTMATRAGADLATSGLVASALVVGQLCGNIPAGWLVAKVGERMAMVISGFLALAGALMLPFASNIGVLALAIFINGFCAAAFGLARHSFMATHVPFHFRARALALLGGSYRFGMFLGPFVGALLLGSSGHESAVIWFLIACLAVTVLLVWFGPDPEREFEAGAREPITGEATAGVSLPDSPNAKEGVFSTMVRFRAVLARLGLAASTLSALRAARQVVLPIWGVAIGLDAQTISLVVGISGALDFALFYASGQVMDRFGRLWAVIPSMLMMSFAFLMLALTGGWDSATAWFIALAAVIGVANGLSSGLLLTLGADLAPKQNPAPFLGSWRTLTSAGAAAAPVLFSGMAAVAPIGVATAAMGVIGLFGTWAFLRWMPRKGGRA
ncbi:putative MFS family arabinose efflux permease [Leucobacter komagatae]|uniref:Putative MFS family arabinose efflux permease n=2 Tax=Leucobacter komagatae TaxID=55969 RepID=A0A542Y726_9MICO|nr:putative MFS family arabinose efflux permease [Leucobacter komagatae]